MARTATAAEAVFDRPTFIVSSPRSGSSMLFETLALAPGLHTIGGETHGLLEKIDGLHPKRRGWNSNRLEAADADDGRAEELRRRITAALRDRDGAPPAPQARVRLLEKTPKNALRLPFLTRVFPDARFIFLYRDPLHVMASMVEGWESGRMRTYGALPDWRGPAWSMLLVPGWRELNGLAIPEIVARQWTTVLTVLLDDLEALDADRWTRARYEDVIAAPEAEMRQLAAWIGVGWDRALPDQLKRAAHTLSEPHPEKWRRREVELAALAPIWAATAERAARTAGS